jgi:hypothetical protein
MPFPVLGSNSAVAGYEIDNSLRFNDGDSAVLSRTTASSGNANTFTFSFWVKRGDLSGNNQYIFNFTDGHNDSLWFGGLFHTDNSLKFQTWYGGTTLDTNSLFRDTSAWYHIVLAVDTTQSTDSNRLKIYVNGEQQTSLGTATYPSQNHNYTGVGNSGTKFVIGALENTSPAYSSFYDGYISEFNFIDGSALAPTDFGETNDNGVWIPKAYEGTYGTNGFFLEFQDSGSLGTDTSGNGNNFTATNLAATDQTTDTPTNNFNTLNSLANQMGGTLSEGSTQCAGAAASDKHVFGTFGLTKGKWYWEVKVTDQGARGSVWVSDSDHNDIIGTNYAGHSFWSGGTPTSGSSNSTVGSGASNNDIICFAVDLDNGQLFMSKNADIDTSGTANITGLATTGLDRDYRISQRETGNPATTMQHNYGNPPFTISSGNSDANGYGNFEYAVPSGYYALCTKNLAEYG